MIRPASGRTVLAFAATAQTPAAPSAKINLFARQAKATPDRVGFTHTGPATSTWRSPRRTPWS